VCVHQDKCRQEGTLLHGARPGALSAETFLLGARIGHGEALCFLVRGLAFAFKVMKMVVADRDGNIALAATALTVALADNDSSR
jgi:hypothetical protein